MTILGSVLIKLVMDDKVLTFNVLRSYVFIIQYSRETERSTGRVVSKQKRREMEINKAKAKHAEFDLEAELEVVNMLYSLSYLLENEFTNRFFENQVQASARSFRGQGSG